MEGNRDEAEKCIGIAREALEAGNRDRALRFLGKAQKLYPTETARGEAQPPPAAPSALLPRPPLLPSPARPLPRSVGTRGAGGGARGAPPTPGRPSARVAAPPAGALRRGGPSGASSAPRGDGAAPRSARPGVPGGVGGSAGEEKGPERWLRCPGGALRAGGFPPSVHAAGVRAASLPTPRLHFPPPLSRQHKPRRTDRA